MNPTGAHQNTKQKQANFIGAKTWLKNPQLVLVSRTLHGFLDQSQTEVKQN